MLLWVLLLHVGCCCSACDAVWCACAVQFVVCQLLLDVRLCVACLVYCGVMCVRCVLCVVVCRCCRMLIVVDLMYAVCRVVFDFCYCILCDG